MRAHRLRTGLTQERLADLAQLSLNAISALERGERRRPYPQTVRALAAALGLDSGEEAELATAARAARQPPQIPDRPASAAPRLPVPRQLPLTVSDFLGRNRDMGRLDALLPAAPTDETRPVVVAVIAGTAGVGKTTLAVMWSHRVRDRFPDGQLYANLRGYHPGPPATPAEVLDGFLRALDVPADKIPPDLEQRSALFRSLLDGRRILVVLDNANSAEQVRPLLPGSAPSLALVTSRAALTGLAVNPGAIRIGLDLLREDDAMQLLRTMVGERRAAAEPQALSELAGLCANLPLALRLGGQRAAARPDLPLAGLVADLADETERLELLSSGSDDFTAVGPVFSWSYHNLTPPHARMFRLLGLHPGQDVSGAAAAALAAVTCPEAHRQLDALVEAHLVEQACGGYRMHDLLRAYARALAERDEADDAFRRLAGFYLYAAAAADQLLHPGRGRAVVSGAPAPAQPVTFGGYDEALAWCERELTSLLAVTHTAADRGLHDAAWQLANNLWSFFYLTTRRTEWTATFRVGLAAAKRGGHQAGQARMHNGLGAALQDTPRRDEAAGHYREALDLFRAVGDTYGVGSVLGNLGTVYFHLGRHDDALQHYGESLRIFRQLDSPYLEGIALGNVAETYLELGRHDEALRAFQRVLDLCRQINHRHGEALTLVHLGAAYAGLHRYDEATRHLTLGMERCRDNGDRRTEALALRRLGGVHHATGQLDTARRHWVQAATIFAELDDVQAAQVYELLHAAGPHRPRTAVRGHGASTPADLTPAEWRIAGLAATGLTNREVAAIAYVSAKTVEARLSQVYLKLGVRNRTELATVLPAIPSREAPSRTDARRP